MKRDTSDGSSSSSSSSCSPCSCHRVKCRVKSPRLNQMLSVTSTVIVIFASIFNMAESIIEIKSLNMPDRIENGTRESIILDCIYSLDENKDKIKLVIKWFFRDDPVPIYQWIPELNKKSYSPRFINKIDDTFSVPHGTPFTKYRALHLINITTDLSGTYSCHVASLTSQDSKKKDLIVYGECLIFPRAHTRASRGTFNICSGERHFNIFRVLLARSVSIVHETLIVDTSTLYHCDACISFFLTWCRIFRKTLAPAAAPAHCINMCTSVLWAGHCSRKVLY